MLAFPLVFLMHQGVTTTIHPTRRMLLHLSGIWLAMLCLSLVFVSAVPIRAQFVAGEQDTGFFLDSSGPSAPLALPDHSLVSATGEGGLFFWDRDGSVLQQVRGPRLTNQVWRSLLERSSSGQLYVVSAYGGNPDRGIGPTNWLVHRFGADRTWDPSYSFSAGSNIISVHALDKGAILLLGFDAVARRSEIRKLNSQGLLDFAFQFGKASPPHQNVTPAGFFQRKDGRVLVYGSGTTSSTENALPGLFLMFPDGTPDPNFSFATSNYWHFSQIAIDPLRGGFFALASTRTSPTGTVERALLRFNEDGKQDPEWKPVFDSGLQQTRPELTSMAVDKRGRLWLSGPFSSKAIRGAPIFAARPLGLTRLLADGSEDYQFAGCWSVVQDSLTLTGYDPDLGIYVRDASSSTSQAGRITFARLVEETAYGIPPSVSPLHFLSTETSIVLTEGTTNALDVVAPIFGSSPISFQWLLNGKPLVGETNQRLRLTAINKRHNGPLAVLASNAWGVVQQQLRCLVVESNLKPSSEEPEMPAFLEQPGDVLVPPVASHENPTKWSTVQISAAVSGRNLGYRWILNNLALASNRLNKLTLVLNDSDLRSTLGAKGAISAMLVLSNSMGSVTSAPFSIRADIPSPGQPLDRIWSLPRLSRQVNTFLEGDHFPAPQGEFWSESEPSSLELWRGANRSGQLSSWYPGYLALTAQIEPGQVERIQVIRRNAKGIGYAGRDVSFSIVMAEAPELARHLGLTDLRLFQSASRPWRKAQAADAAPGGRPAIVVTSSFSRSRNELRIRVLGPGRLTYYQRFGADGTWSEMTRDVAAGLQDISWNAGGVGLLPLPETAAIDYFLAGFSYIPSLDHPLPPLFQSVQLPSAVEDSVFICPPVAPTYATSLWQWFRDGVEVTGADQICLNILRPTPADSGAYVLKEISPLGTYSRIDTRISIYPGLPWIESVLPLLSQQTRVAIKTRQGFRGVLERSHNLKAWTPAATLTNATSYLYDDRDPSLSSNTFYRIRPLTQ